MCLGIACEVVEVEDRDACLLRVGTGVQRCFTGLVEPLERGDWVLMHAGFAVQRISREEARANLALVRRAARLQEQARAGDAPAGRPATGDPPAAAATSGEEPARATTPRDRRPGRHPPGGEPVR